MNYTKLTYHEEDLRECLLRVTKVIISRMVVHNILDEMSKDGERCNESEFIDRRSIIQNSVKKRDREPCHGSCMTWIHTTT